METTLTESAPEDDSSLQQRLWNISQATKDGYVRGHIRKCELTDDDTIRVHVRLPNAEMHTQTFPMPKTDSPEYAFVRLAEDCGYSLASAEQLAGGDGTDGARVWCEPTDPPAPRSTPPRATGPIHSATTRPIPATRHCSISTFETRPVSTPTIVARVHSVTTARVRPTSSSSTTAMSLTTTSTKLPTTRSRTCSPTLAYDRPIAPTDASTTPRCSLRGDTPSKRASSPTTTRSLGAHSVTSPSITATADIEDGWKHSPATPTTTLSIRSPRSTASIPDVSRSALAGAVLRCSRIPPLSTSCLIPRHGVGSTCTDTDSLSPGRRLPIVTPHS
jgi:hypothetical protein